MRKLNHKLAGEALAAFASQFNPQELLWNGRKLHGMKVVCRNAVMKAGHTEAEADSMVKEQVKALFGKLVK